MRSYGVLHPTDGIPLPPDITQTLLIAGSSGQAMDWHTGATSTLADAAAGLVNIVRLTGQSTVGAALNFVVNLSSTKAAAPSSGTSTEGTTGFGHVVMGSATFQVPGGSTGYSVAALSSGYIVAEMWKKGG